MLENLNYDPEDVQTGKAYIASIAGSGVAFGFLIVGIGEPPQTVAIAPKLAQMKDVRIGDTFEISYVGNFAEHSDRVPWRAVALYNRVEGSMPKVQEPTSGSRATDPKQSTYNRRTIEGQIMTFMAEGSVWDRDELYIEIFSEDFDLEKASEEARVKHDGIGQCLQRLHDTGQIACAKVFAPASKVADGIYYAQTVDILAQALMGYEEAEWEETYTK